ncbi:MAG: amidohydrolase, partial [Planctomycetes bacterium]|nr:amidohydrolase [Planctomycetota bacterium]
MLRIPLLALLLSAITGCATAAAETTRAFTGAKIIPIDGDEIESGVLIVRGGKIIAVGPADKVRIPADAEKVDAKGRVIMPGLVCTHSHIGGPGAADGSAPIQPGVRVYDSLNVHDSGFRRALAGGLTTLNIMPGSGHLCSGQTIYVKLRFHEGRPRTIDDLFILDANGKPTGGLKMANGTNSMNRGSGFPGTRGKSAFLIREQFIKAREYKDKMDDAGDDDAKRPARDLHLETLLEAMQGKRIVHYHTHRHDDIMTVL